MLTGFASVALLLAVVGVFGGTAFAVGQRRREFGVRLALGAVPRQILVSVLRREVRVASASLVIGIGAAVGATRGLESYLYDVSATDVATYGAVCLFLSVVVLGAGFLPARAASRVDPAVTLRD